MKNLNSLIVIVLSLLSLPIASCIQEDADQCVNALDCVNGFVCIDGMCLDPNAGTGDIDKTSGDNDTAVLLDNDNTVADSDGVQPLDYDNNENDADQTTSDAEIDEVPDPDTSIDCDPGSHYEAEGDDENGDGARGCVKNVICASSPEPCNGGQCTELEFTVSCKCTAGYAGRWCTDCDTGYLKSTVDNKCKPDCDHGTFSCTGTKECGVDPVKNEAGCVCKEFFSGTECTSCDAAHFCSNHGTCAASGANAVCTCNEAWAGNANCSTCTTGYLVDGANCIPGCEYYCGATAGFLNVGGELYTVVETSHGTCQVISGNATCVCEAGWLSTSKYVLLSMIKPACSDCDTANPPVGGCPAE